MNKKLMLLTSILSIAVSVAGCSNSAENNASITETEVRIVSTSLPAELVTESNEFTETTVSQTEPPENEVKIQDNDQSFIVTKFDSSKSDLNDNQKMLLDYFDDNYLKIIPYQYDRLKLNPDIYNGARIRMDGYVKNIMSSEESNDILLWIGVSEEVFLYRSYSTHEDYEKYVNEISDHYILLKGNENTTVYSEGSHVVIYGRYTGNDTVDYNGTTYTVPVIEYIKSCPGSFGFEPEERYDFEYIKAISGELFGEDISFRKPTADNELQEYYIQRQYEQDPYIYAELNNPKNSKFRKYKFYTKNGKIEDANELAFSQETELDDKIFNTIDFAPDFNHIFLFSYYYGKKPGTLECYDRDLNLLWEKEFEDMPLSLAYDYTKSSLYGVSPAYDYTRSNLYVVDNNGINIIDISTGELLAEPFDIGEDCTGLSIRKLTDGILIRNSKSVSKYDLNGNLIWNTVLSEDDNEYTIFDYQVINGNIILNSGELVLNEQTGEVHTLNK